MVFKLTLSSQSSKISLKQQVSLKENIVFTRDLNPSFTENFEIRLRDMYGPVATVCIPLFVYELNLLFSGTVTVAFYHVFNIVYTSSKVYQLSLV